MASAGVIVLAGSAFAADLAPPPYVPPAPIFSWTGFYYGAQVGYGWGKNNFNVNDSFGDFNRFSYTTNGVIGGLHVGYNMQWNQLVLGLEGDIDATSQSKQFNGPFPFGSSLVGGGLLAAPLGGNFNYTVHHVLEASIRGRVGYAWDRVLVYATGGVALGDFNTGISGTFPAGVVVGGPNAGPFNAFGGSTNFSTDRVGWTVGGGLEYALTNNWSLRAEYRYTDFGHYTVLTTAFNTPALGAAGVSLSRHFTDNRVQVGFSWKMVTAAPAPVVAKY